MDEVNTKKMNELKWQIVDKNTGEVVEKFRCRATAESNLWRYKETYVGCDLEIIKIEEEDES